MNIQIYNGQTKYKNRTLTHSLQQPSPETSPFSIVTRPGSQLLSISQTYRKSDNYL